MYCNIQQLIGTASSKTLVIEAIAMHVVKWGIPSQKIHDADD